MRNCNKEQLIALLYDDLPPAGRAAIEAHLGGCAECRRELADLQGVRQHLAAWAPPEPQLDFRVIRGSAAPAAGTPSRWGPAWALAAAASLFLLAGAAAIANLEVRSGPEGFTVRTGWGTPVRETAEGPAALDVRPVPAASVADASEHLRLQVAALERRLQELEEARTTDGPALAAAGPGLTPEQLAAVRRIVADSESRQRAERAQQVTQVWNDFSAARASDFVRVHEALGRVQGLTNYQLKQHRESIDSLYRVSLQR